MITLTWHGKPYWFIFSRTSTFYCILVCIFRQSWARSQNTMKSSWRDHIFKAKINKGFAFRAMNRTGAGSILGCVLWCFEVKLRGSNEDNDICSNRNVLWIVMLKCSMESILFVQTTKEVALKEFNEIMRRLPESCGITVVMARVYKWHLSLVQFLPAELEEKPAS